MNEASWHGSKSEEPQSRTLYRNAHMRIVEDRFTSAGANESFIKIVNRRDGVCVISIDAGGNLILVNQFRPAIKRSTLEAASGRINPGESKLKAAKRELREETGFVAEKWTYLGKFYPKTALLSQLNHLFLAQELDYVGQALDEDEVISVIKVPLSQALAWVKRGRILEASTLIGLFRALDHLQMLNYHRLS